MTDTAIKELAQKFQINLQMVHSWKEITGFTDPVS